MVAPLISVCIPTYNAVRYLPQAIESVTKQDFEDYELVICDDGSTDTTEEICVRYNDPRIRYLRFSGPSGQARNFNRCLAEARGSLIILLHADDFLLPGFLSDRLARLQAHPQAGFVFGAIQIVDRDGASISVSQPWQDDRVLGSDYMYECLLHGCLVSPPSLMARKSCVENAGPFRTDITWGHDWEWTLRLAENADAIYAARPLAAYRIHDGSGTAEILRNGQNVVQERRILQEALARLRTRERATAIRRSAFRALSRRQMYFAEQALLALRRRVARSNLLYAALADSKMLLRPAFWALFLGSFAPLGWYARYRRYRIGTSPSAR